LEEREDTGQDKTEDPTEERRKQFREKGQIVSPREVVSSISILLMASVVFAFSQSTSFYLKALFQRSWYTFATPPNTNPLQHIAKVLQPFVTPLVFFTLIVTSLPTILSLVLTRFNWSWDKVQFNTDKINFFKGVQNLFSFSTLYQTGKSLLKCIVLGFLGFLMLKKELTQSPLYYKMPPALFFQTTLHIIFKIIIFLGFSFLFIGFLDFLYNFIQLEKSMKMTKQELKEEARTQDVDPHIKNRRKRLAREILMRQSISRVSEATFVVTNPQHYAVAIRYVKGMAAPRIVSKGQDFLALKIKEIANKNDIIIVENKPLARTLYKLLRIGQEIPPSLYTAIIEIMKHIYHVRGRTYFDRFYQQDFF